jgi:phosphate starvation-inducible membrane PsiE
MVDILLSDLRSLIYYDDKFASLEKLESDLKTIDSLQEQHRRVLITFLMQSWVNLKEVLILMKIGEIYKNIAEELVDIFLFMELLEERP